MLPDLVPSSAGTVSPSRLNAPTGAWCSLTEKFYAENEEVNTSQCTYRCVVLPDVAAIVGAVIGGMSQCTYRCVVLPDMTFASVISHAYVCLNAPTGAWCSLTSSFLRP